ncbi:MAG TPA: hypothetical protein VEA69_07335 [Tepidisphaeraceae bacterium]|nr:hypothetical protein [Tepidisphaeraceae bacterium]
MTARLLALLLLTATPAAYAADEKPAPAVDAKPLTPAARAVAATGSDYGQMPAVLGLEGEALEKFTKALAARDDGYKAWAESEKGKAYTAAQKEVAAAQGAARPGAGPRRGGRRGGAAAPQANAAGNPKLAEAQKKYEPLRAEQEKVRRHLRATFNKQFTTAQLRVLAGHALYDRAIDRFAQAKLSDDQRALAHVACSALTAGLSDEDLAKDPYLAPDGKLVEKAVEVIKAHVLRADQSDGVRAPSAGRTASR